MTLTDQAHGPSLARFAAAYAPADEAIAARWLTDNDHDAAADARIDSRATRLIETIRARAGGLGGIEDFLHEYSLSTREGLALMVLAEALLRVPDAETADRLIEDKLAAGDFTHHDTHSNALLVSASAWALGLSARIIQPGETPEGVLQGLAKRIGLPALRTAARQVMRLLGSHFVLGQTIAEALDRAAKEKRYRYSFDMLGEGARNANDAERYFESYRQAIEAIGAADPHPTLPARGGISVKLSALHPRFEAISETRVLRELTPKVLELARLAKRHELNFTIDAEEADRLELTLDVMAATLKDSSLAGWNGFGLAVQAYQKRAPYVIDYLIGLADALDRRLMVRLVKGAYWDTEIKRAQERGLADYPVFTRKAMTDLSFAKCARQLLAARNRIFPQFATHNALTVATIIEDAGGLQGYEFQRLHGMGEALYRELLSSEKEAACRIYAPVGGHRDLLAYLVRRLLENGANSSFVAVAADSAVPIDTILRRPSWVIGRPENARNRALPLPRDLYAPERRNSCGLEFGDRAALSALRNEIAAHDGRTFTAAPLALKTATPRTVLSPIDGHEIGLVTELDPDAASEMTGRAKQGVLRWAATPIGERAAILERAADALEAKRGLFLSLLQREGGKTLDDALAEFREAVDYCRYYAARAREQLQPQSLPGPTGETNELRYRPRGVFVCISPWNFPLAIFLGQVAAALVAGNAVVAKPAEQTPLIAAQAIALLHEAGVPKDALHLAPGDGAVGAAFVSHPDVAGVAFTGSTEVAWKINRALAAKDGPIVPLIAETGGINAMIVDATALPEQVTDDVLTSVFRSAGQRCSALRLLCLQDEIADGLIAMIAGALRELQIGDPRDPATHIGPVIDKDAQRNLDRWLVEMSANIVYRYDERAMPSRGTFITPAIIALNDPSELRREIFGPILHIVRWRSDELDALLDAIARNGTGLTLGIHSRIDVRIGAIAARMANGNVYVNRSMIGAVVGTQPFGGTGLSGTGPKAGGPNYLRRFTTEQVLTVNVAAAGGNATLLSASD